MNQFGISERDKWRPRCSFQDGLQADPTCLPGCVPDVPPALHLASLRTLRLCSPVQRCMCVGGRGRFYLIQLQQRPRASPRSHGRLPGGADQEGSCEGPHRAAFFLLLSESYPRSSLAAGFTESTKGLLPMKDS